MKLGEFLYQMRQNKKMRQYELAYGYCSVSVISKIESGQMRPDYYLANALLERLGVYSNKYFTLITKKEYDFYLIQNTVFNLIDNGNFEEAREIISDYNYVNEINTSIQEQFLCMVEGLLSNNIEEQIGFFEKALWIEKGNILEVVDRYLSECEHMILCMLCDRYLCVGQVDVVIKVLSEVIKNVEKIEMDKEQKIIVLPKEILLLCRALEDRFEYEEIYIYTENMIKIIKEEFNFLYLKELLEFNIRAREKINGVNDIKERSFELETLRSLWIEFDKQQIQKKVLNKNFFQKDGIEIVNEHISNSRKRLGMSQEQFSEGICSPVTMSRIECGVQMPSDRYFKKLTDKLKNHSEYYYSNIFTDDFELLEMSWKINYEFYNKNIIETRFLLKELERKLDLSISDNYQFVELWKIRLEEHVTSDRIKKLLQMDSEQGELSFNTENEILLGMQLCIVLYKEKEYAEALNIVRICIENCFGASGNHVSKMNILILLHYNLLTLLDKLNFDEEVEEVFLEAMKYIFLTGKSAHLPKIIANYVSVLEKKGGCTQDRLKKYIKIAINVCLMYNREKEKEILQGYYQEKFS